MKITFASTKLAKVMNDDARPSRTYGAVLAVYIRRCLDDFAAATALEDMKTLPGRYEELSGDRKEQFSVRLTANFRLILEPKHDPGLLQLSGGLDWKRITAVTVIEVIDYH